jgi:chromosome segregation ATPase
MDFLKDILGDDLFNQVLAKLEGTDVKLANLSTGDYVSKDKHDAEIRAAEKERDGYKAQLSDLSEQIEAAQGSEKTIGDLNAKIKQIQADNNTKVAEIEASKEQLKRDAKIDLAVVMAGARNLESVLVHVNKEKVSLNDQGELVGLADQLETIKTNHEYLFGEPKPVFKTAPPNPPSEPKTPQSEWLAKYTEAKSKGDTQAAIKIKQEAYDTDGVVLN